MKKQMRESNEGESERLRVYHMTAHKPLPVTVCHLFGWWTVTPLYVMPSPCPPPIFFAFCEQRPSTQISEMLVLLETWLVTLWPMFSTPQWITPQTPKILVLGFCCSSAISVQARLKFICWASFRFFFSLFTANLPRIQVDAVNGWIDPSCS